MSAGVLSIENVTEDTRGAANDAPLVTRLERDATLWMLRALALAQRHRPVFTGRGDSGATEGDDRERQLLQRVKRCLGGASADSLHEVVQLLPSLLEAADSKSAETCASDRTVQALSDTLGLSSCETELLRFQAALFIDSDFDAFVDFHFRGVSLRETHEILARMFGVSVATIRETIQPQGILYRARLMKLNRGRSPGRSLSLADRFQVRDGLMQMLESANGDGERLVRTMAVPAPEDGLTSKDFEHLRLEWNLAQNYLQGALEKPFSGANILLHGAPGVGKTEFARALARDAGAQAYEIKSCSLDNEVFNPAERRDFYLLASSLLARAKSSVLIFDDADGSLGHRVGPGSQSVFFSKAATNQMLEKNPVPTLWILNEPELVDPAILRRFDITIEFRRPRRDVLRRQMQQRLAPLGAPQDWIERAARSRDLTPAMIGKLERVTRRVRHAGDPAELMGDVLLAGGIALPPTPGSAFDESYCNCAPGIELVKRFVERSEESRLLLHGPTGTGKTSLAKHLAGALGLTHKVVRPSDLLGPLVGQTEQQVADLFCDTDPETELIILDEFEAFAEDRQGAQRGWEISKVAELLSQLDEYDGRVIACTNFLDQVDKAIRRRFQLKARVDALTAAQRAGLLTKFGEQLGLARPARAVDGSGELDGLSYGHVKNAAEIAELTDCENWPEFLGLVRAELESTMGVKRPMGFAA